MNRLLVATALTIAIALAAFGPDSGVKIIGKHQPEDVAAIQKVMTEAMNDGWEKYDVEKAVAEYTDDVYFINAFGIQKESKAEIRKFVTRIFAQPGFRSRRLQPLSFVSIRFIRPDIASVHTYQETTGQLKRDGTPEGLRKTHVFRIMLKQKGRWLTDSFQVMDERP